MALIECHECKAKISDSASIEFGEGRNCPQCGAETLQSKRDTKEAIEGMNTFFKQIGYFILGFILLIMFLAAVLAFG
jgi:DNA-directed RNA polymerase subunit RPC12/RpoP|tara:strand:+ start:293 stop:523 length:231 start_codon:yes stop_codon:yes gene_type:complete